MKATNKSILVVVVAAAAACLAAGGPSDYKKTVQRRVAPAKVECRIPGRTLVDFGKMAFGFLEFVPPAGARGPYEVRLGELLKPDGSVNMKPGATIRAARVTGTIEADGVLRVPLVADKRNTTGGREGGAILIPPEHGVIMPFRYVEVMQAPFTVTPETVRMVAVNYPIDLSESSFSCSDERLNRIYDLCKHTILVSSFAGLYVDGDRERIPYEADAYINQLSDYAVHSDYSLGRASHAYLMKHPTWPTEWKQHSIFMAWADWMWSGDTGALAEFYEPLRKEKLLEKYRRASDGLLATGGERPRGKLVNANGAADIVDWPLCERDGFVFKEVNAVVNAFYYRNLLRTPRARRAQGVQRRVLRREARRVPRRHRHGPRLAARERGGARVRARAQEGREARGPALHLEGHGVQRLLRAVPARGTVPRGRGGRRARAHHGARRPRLARDDGAGRHHHDGGVGGEVQAEPRPLPRLGYAAAQRHLALRAGRDAARAGLREDPGASAGRVAQVGRGQGAHGEGSGERARGRGRAHGRPPRARARRVGGRRPRRRRRPPRLPLIARFCRREFAIDGAKRV